MSKSLIDGLNDFYSPPEEETQVCVSSGNRPWSRPLKSVALAVQPGQVAEAAADAAARGVPTDFTPEGEPILRDRDHKKRYLRAYGMYDRDAGYGDAAPLLHKGERAPPSRVRELAREMVRRGLVGVRKGQR